MTIDHTMLIAAAQEGRKAAYAPFSGYKVGAAILGPDGSIWAGCNVENASFGLTICAERAAVCRMVADGVRKIAAVVVATRDGGPPCGACLQVLAEFIPEGTDVDVVCVADSGTSTTRRFSSLYPVRFGSGSLGPREDPSTHGNNRRTAGPA